MTGKSLFDQIHCQPQKDQLSFAAQLLSRSFSTQRAPSTASEAIQIWDFVAANARDAAHVQQLLADHCDFDLYSLELHRIAELSHHNDASRRKRKDVLRIFFTWNVWPWRILSDLTDQVWSKNLLGELVAFAQVTGDLDKVRTLLQEARDKRLQSSNRGVTRKPELTIRDVKGARETYNRVFAVDEAGHVLRKRKLPHLREVDPSLGQDHNSNNSDTIERNLAQEQLEVDPELGRGRQRELSRGLDDSLETDSHSWLLDDNDHPNLGEEDENCSLAAQQFNLVLPTPQSSRSGSPVEPAPVVNMDESLAGSNLQYRLELVSEVSAFAARLVNIRARMNQDVTLQAAQLVKQTQLDDLRRRLVQTRQNVEAAERAFREMQANRAGRSSNCGERQQYIQALDQSSEALRETREGLRRQISDDQAVIAECDAQLETLQMQRDTHRTTEQDIIHELQRKLDQQSPYHETLHNDVDDLGTAVANFLHAHRI